MTELGQNINESVVWYSKSVLAIINLQNVSVLATQQPHQPLVINLQIDEHLVYCHICAQILLHKLVHFVALLLQVLACYGYSYLLALNQMLLQTLLLN